MASITQTPNTFNSAYVPNVFVVDGIGTADRYVLQVRQGNTVLSTFKQPPNASGVGIFDIQRVLQSYLTSQIFIEETVKLSNTPGALFRYNVLFGTETGTNVTLTSNGVIYNVLNAYDNWRTLNSDLTPFVPQPGTLDCETSQDLNVSYPTSYDFLTNYPGTIPVSLTDWHTLSFINMAPSVETNNIVYNQAPFWVRINTTLNGNAADDIVYAISAANGNTVRTDCNDAFDSFTDANRIATVGAGPMNIAPLLVSPYDAYQVRIYSYNVCVGTTIGDCTDYSEILNDGYVGDLIFQKSFTVTNETCQRFEPIQLSFINQWGIKDYFTFDKRNTEQVTTQKNNFVKPLGTWNADSFTISSHGRGKTTFSSTAMTTVTMQSDWMSDKVSEWLQELYQSTNVNIYIDGMWEPCTILTSTYTQKTNARNQLFQHDVQVEFANNQKLQRG